MTGKRKTPRPSPPRGADQNTWRAAQNPARQQQARRVLQTHYAAKYRAS